MSKYGICSCRIVCNNDVCTHRKRHKIETNKPAQRHYIGGSCTHYPRPEWFCRCEYIDISQCIEVENDETNM